MLHATSSFSTVPRGPSVDEGEVRPGAGWEGALADDGVGPGGHARDRPEEVLGEIDGVRPEVAENSEPCLVPEKPPGENAPGVGGVCGDPLRAEVAHLADCAGVDQLAGMSHGWRMPVVEADDRPHPGARDGLRDRSGLGGEAADRLLDPDVLARPGRGHGDVSVQPVGGRDADGLDLGIVDDLPPVVGRALVPEPLDRGPRALGVLVGCDDEAGDTRAVREVVAASAVRDAVHPTHPADTDQADPDRARHGATLEHRPGRSGTSRLRPCRTSPSSATWRVTGSTAGRRNPEAAPSSPPTRCARSAAPGRS